MSETEIRNVDNDEQNLDQPVTNNKKGGKRVSHKPKMKSIEPVQPTVKTADLAASLAANLFAALNPMEVEYMRYHPFNQPSRPTIGIIVTDVNPDELYYPEGWYYAKGYFRNKFNTSSGLYEEIPMHKRDGTPW